MTTDTPRTDAAFGQGKHGVMKIPYETSCKLECELEASKAEVERLRSTIQSFILVSPIELAELKVIAATWMARAEKAEAEVERLREALDTLTLIVGLTPVAGNKSAMQEAYNLARKALNPNPHT